MLDKSLIIPWPGASGLRRPRKAAGHQAGRRCNMPIYTYLCTKCNHTFTLMMTVREYEKAKPKCPKCQSTEVEQQVQMFSAVTSKKS